MHLVVDDQGANMLSTMGTLSRPPRRYRLFGRCNAEWGTVRRFRAVRVVPPRGPKCTRWGATTERFGAGETFSPTCLDLGRDAPTDPVGGR